MVTDETVATLKGVVDKIRQEKEVLDEREKSLTRVIDSMLGNASHVSRKPKQPQYSISSERLAKIRKLLEKEGRMRQSDIARKTKLNSGAVSVGLKLIEQEGIAYRTEEREDGSWVWVINNDKDGSTQNGSTAAATA